MTEKKPDTEIPKVPLDGPDLRIVPTEEMPANPDKANRDRQSITKILEGEGPGFPWPHETTWGPRRGES